MKRFALAALLLLASPLSALAAPASDAQVDRLIEVMRAEQTLQTVLPQVQAQMDKIMQAALEGRTLTPEQQAQMEAFMARHNQRLRETLTWEKMEPLYRDIYRQTFSAEEMDAMIGFYSSPAGQAVLAKMPALIQHSMTAMQQLITPMAKEMQRDIEQTVAALDATP